MQSTTCPGTLEVNRHGMKVSRDEGVIVFAFDCKSMTPGTFIFA